MKISKNRQVYSLPIFFDKKFCTAFIFCRFAIPFGEVLNSALTKEKFFKIKFCKI
jgi:hypothetical protein